MQLRFSTGELTSEQYVAQEYWRKATLSQCPEHPRGGCGFKRHTPYVRKVPEDVVIPRWYCPLAGRTFSLLPDCAAARLPSSLADVDRVAAVAAASPSLEAAADVLRPDITLPAGVRWIRRRIDGVRKFLHAFVGLFPDLFIGASTPLAASRLAAATAGQPVFVFLRQVGEHFLPRLSSSVGFAPRRRCTSSVPLPQQHNMGPDERAQSG